MRRFIYLIFCLWICQSSFSLNNLSIEKLAEVFKQRHHLPGLAIVYGDRQNYHSINLGLRSTSDHLPVTDTTQFRIASVSKLISTVALLHLLEHKGMPSLKRSIYPFIHATLKENTPEYFRSITIDHLITHTSGIRHYRLNRYKEEKESNVAIRSRAEALMLHHAILDRPLFQPGQGFHYSTYGINMVQDIIESLSGHTFENYVREVIFMPARMHHSSFDTGLDMSTRYYIGRGGKLGLAPKINPRWKLAGGGMLSTASDLYRFAQALTGGKLLSISSFAALTSQNPYRIPGNDYARGVHVLGVTTDGHKWLGHGGGATGGAAYLLFRDDGKYIFSAVTNLEIPSALIGNLLNQVAIQWEPTNPSLSIKLHPHQ